MPQKYDQFIKKFPQTEQNKPLAPFTTLQVGGPADLYYALTNTDELPTLIRKAEELEIAYFLLGGGSNTIFHENGFRGLIIHMKANTIVIEGERIIADAGALLSQVLQAAIKNNLVGMEKFMGLPGTVGGAVRGNAGAFGKETRDVIEKAILYNQKKGLHQAPASDLDFSYRSSSIKKYHGKEIVLQVTYKLTKGDTKAAMKENAIIIAARLSKQPAGKNTGSFFKNPSTEQSAGKLLDEAGCKGLQIGDIQVSGQHANWIMNRGNATQTEIIELMRIMQKRVKERFNVQLEPEVQFVGENGPLATLVY